METLLTLKQAAETLRMSQCSLYRKVAMKELPHIRLGTSIRFKPSALEKYVADHAIEPASGDKRAK